MKTKIRMPSRTLELLIYGISLYHHLSSPVYCILWPKTINLAEIGYSRGKIVRDEPLGLAWAIGNKLQTLMHGRTKHSRFTEKIPALTTHKGDNS